jgi:hypothetical protein
MMSLTSVKKKKHNKEPNLCDRPSWEDVPYGKIWRPGTIDIQALVVKAAKGSLP